MPNLNTSTLNILKNLPSAKLYADGVGLSLGDWEWNWRVSNLLEGAMTLGTSAASLVGLGLTALSHLPSASAIEIEEDLPKSFRHINPVTAEITNYIATGRTSSPGFIKTFKQMLHNVTNIHETGGRTGKIFETVKEWRYESDDTSIILEFAREVGKNVTEAEKFIIQFFNQAVELINNEDKQTRELLWIGTGITLGLTAIIIGGVTLYVLRKENIHRRPANHTAEEEGRLIPTQPENYGATQSDIVIPTEGKKAKEKKLTNAERLDGIDCEVDEDLICPITEEIFTDPVCTNFGNTFERAAIVKCMRNSNNQCPLRNGTITSINPVLSTRNKAKEFVETQEEIHKSQSKNVSTLKK